MLGSRDAWALDRTVAHLNHGSYGAVPLAVIGAQDAWRTRIEADPVRFFLHDAAPAIEAARLEAAGFVDADPDGLALVDNVTAAVATVLRSFGIGEDDEVVLTEHGYEAVRLSVVASGAKPVIARVGDGNDPAQALAAALTVRTKLAIVDQVTSPTAKLFDVRTAIVAMRARGVPCLVDAAHVPGMLDVSLRALDPDLWTGNLHKWAFAPRGAGLLYARDTFRPRLRPLVTSFTFEQGYPRSFSYAGTRDYTPFLCVPVAIAFHRSLDGLQRHNADLAAAGAEAVARAARLEVRSDGPVSMRILALPDGVAGSKDQVIALQRTIAERLRTEVAITGCDGRGYVRLSAQAYNQIDEYERLGAGLRGLL